MAYLSYYCFGHIAVLMLIGRTATITAHTCSHGRFSQLHHVTGGGWGGQAVNEEFKQFLIKIVGATVFLKFSEEEKRSEWRDLERKFEITKNLMYVGRTFTVSIPNQLSKMYNESFNESIQDAVEASPYAKEIRFIFDKMKINAAVIEGFFMNAMKAVISNVEDALMSDSVNKAQNIILVGGFSASPIVQELIEKEFPDLKVLIPPEPEFTTAQGAILHAHHTAPSRSAESSFTYGVQICQISHEGGRSEVKRSETKIFIKKGDTVYEGDDVTWLLRLEVCDEEHVEVHFFASRKKETVSIDEEDINHIKMIKLDVEGNFIEDVAISIYQKDFCFMGMMSGQLVQFGQFE